MTDPREFPCMDDDPRNNGNGYNSPNPYDNYDDREDVEPEDADEYFDDPEELE